MTTAEAHSRSGMGKDLVVYVCLLALAGIQFFIAYQDISASQMFVRMLTVAVIEAGLALLFFHALVGESRAEMVCPDFHSCRDPRDAIRLDRQLPPDQRRAVGKVAR